MVKNGTNKPVVSRAKAMITVARQNAASILAELDVDLGGGYQLKHSPKTEQASNFAFDLTKLNMRDLYEAAPEWGWKDDEKEKEIASEHQHLIVIFKDEKMVGFAAFRYFFKDFFDF